MDALLLSTGATVACSGHVVGPVRPTRPSLGAFVGVGGSGFGAGLLLLRGRSDLSESRRPNSCSLETATGLHNGVYDYSNNRDLFMRITQ